MVGKRIFYAISGGIMVIFMGCATSISNFQNGKVLKKGEFQVGTSCGLGVITEKDIETGKYLEAPMLPLEIWTRYGIFKKFDVGFKGSFPYSNTIDIRRSFLDERAKGWASIALGLGYSWGDYTSSFELEVEGSVVEKSETKHKLRDVLITTYFSKDVLNGIFTFYGCPRYAFRIRSSDRLDKLTNKRTKKDYFGHSVGISVGTSLNIRGVFHLIGELSYLQDISDSRVYQSQVGMAMSFNF
jgi:hypothetical protein